MSEWLTTALQISLLQDV